ncbi:SAM-dependent methyltransferase [Streptomyces pluripotens]|uniref:S-adenosyl-L-methionine-dependent methyltransferase n=1 Tax=Streptomyces pluripotens TaxID=1355015 RepID=A0A221P508_9ACTN|nr:MULTISPECIES: class I SAM-dependent methyltransferase [Streptomyces]ARP72868.1 SAM-dependent methyltransferase [Streptomyces pluripotens]ASN27118.1 SAM-dependent methyltransferase [Streptomyces pluripotens]KIE23580.1 methyltransferase [Streptomyces sp. MUSC 125]MCH0559862.1 class I SAM-dependent methyltransferase [Streptomyces sp. MUM 16J]
MSEQITAEPSSTAVRTALWRALHVQHDDPPAVFDDELGLLLADPGGDWRQRPDMDPDDNPFARAAVITRARFAEDLVAEQLGRGVGQYVILGAGLDTFAQRRTELASSLEIFEVDPPGPQSWKRRRLAELGFEAPAGLHFVPYDLDSGGSWWETLVAAGFDAGRPAVVASLGVSTYLSREAIVAMLRQGTALAPGSTLATTFQLPLDMVEPGPRELRARVEEAARAFGTPFTSFFAPEEILALARDAGFRTAEHIPAAALTARYFADRADGLRPSNAEELLVVTT